MKGPVEVADALTPRASLAIGGPVRHLGGYLEQDGAHARDILAVGRPDGSTLVLDSRAGTLSDPRLLAHLASDEPPVNAQILCDVYLSDESRGHCRRLSAQDLERAPVAAPGPHVDATVAQRMPLRDARGCAYRLRVLPIRRSGLELRWARFRGPNVDVASATVTLRDVVASLQDYEPARSITLHALAAGQPGRVSTRRLRGELARLARSPIVLNRRLRERVERELATGLTMSQIAMRCGRTRRDRHGACSGETTWLARRIGQMPEAGHVEPAAWVHIDTLALIARHGLGVNPNEVEL